MSELGELVELVELIEWLVAGLGLKAQSHASAWKWGFNVDFIIAKVHSSLQRYILHCNI